MQSQALEACRVCIVTLNIKEGQKKTKCMEGLHWKENCMISGVDVGIVYLKCFIMVR